MEDIYIAVLYRIKNSTKEENITEYFSVEKTGLCINLPLRKIIKIFPSIQDKNFFTDIKAKELSFQNIYRQKTFYSAPESSAFPRVFYLTQKDVQLSKKLCYLFCTYSLIKQNIKNGNFLYAAKLLIQFNQDKNSFTFLKDMLKEDTFLLLSFFWIFGFEKDKNEKLIFAFKIFLNSKNDEANIPALPCMELLTLLNYAKGFFEAEDSNRLKEKMKTAIRKIVIEQKCSIVIPVAGTDYTDAQNYLLGKMKMVNSEAVNNLLSEHGGKAEFFFRNYFKDCTISILPEPLNPYDSNAAAVVIKFPCGSEKKIGYLKKEFAEIIAPVLKESRPQVSLYSINESKIEIKIGF